MCIASDFQMYYRDSFVLCDGQPFYVGGVSYPRSLRRAAEEAGEEPSRFANYLYSDHDSLGENLMFFGHLYRQDGSTSGHREILLRDLDVENPRLGYAKVNGQWKWFTYSPEQCAKKGLTPLRLNIKHFPNDVYWSLFNPVFDNECLDYDLLLHGGMLHYKGVRIGRVIGNDVVVDGKFAILSDYITEKLPEGLCLQIV